MAVNKLLMAVRSPMRIWEFLTGSLSFYIARLFQNIECAGRIKVYGTPHIYLHRDAKLIMGSQVTLNSSNIAYHSNMFKGVKILADRPGATIAIGDNTRIHGACIHAYKSVEIGRNCLIAANCNIMDGNGHSLSFDNVEERIHTVGTAKPIVIEDNVWIGINSVVLPGVRIGFGSVIGANSVVKSDIPPFSVAAGNPAVVLKDFSSIANS